MDANLQNVIDIYKLVANLDNSSFLFVLGLAIPLVYGFFTKLFSLDKFLPYKATVDANQQGSLSNPKQQFLQSGAGGFFSNVVPSLIDSLIIGPTIISVIVVILSCIFLTTGAIQLYIKQKDLEIARQASLALKNYFKTNNYCSISAIEAKKQFVPFTKDVKDIEKYFELVLKYYSKEFAVLLEEGDSIISYKKERVAIKANGMVRAYDDSLPPAKMKWFYGSGKDSVFTLWMQDSTVKKERLSLILVNDTLRKQIDEFCINALSSYLTNSYKVNDIASLELIFDHDNHFMREYVYRVVAMYPDRFGLFITGSNQVSVRRLK